MNEKMRYFSRTPMNMPVHIKRLEGKNAAEFIPDVARLRMEVFHEFPYLYEGNLEYEQKYLQTYLNSPRSAIFLAFEGTKVVGASTALPLEHEIPEIKAPFEDRNLPVSQFFYYGESVLQRDLRGRGIGVEFFQLREEWARSFDEYAHVCFCGVIRPEDHPLRPPSYQPLDHFWKKRGFTRMEGVICEISWKDIDERIESPKPLQFWSKSIK